MDFVGWAASAHRGCHSAALRRSRVGAFLFDQIAVTVVGVFCLKTLRVGDDYLKNSAGHCF
jgi:hypothetical protein